MEIYIQEYEEYIHTKYTYIEHNPYLDLAYTIEMD